MDPGIRRAVEEGPCTLSQFPDHWSLRNVRDVGTGSKELLEKEYDGMGDVIRLRMPCLPTREASEPVQAG